MRRDVSLTIVVGSNDTMPDVLARLRSATGGAATLAIPASSSLFLTASEFRALKASAEASRIILTVETDDRLRRQLAHMFHLPVAGLTPSAVDQLLESGLDSEPAPPVHENGDGPRVVAPPPPPRWDPNKDIDPDETEAEELPPPTARRPFPVSGRLLGIGAGALALLVALTVAIGFLLHSATVELTLRRTPATAALTFVVAGPGAEPPGGAAFTVAGEPVTFDVTYSSTVPVTGVEREPDRIAAGSLHLRNTSDAPIAIPAGATFSDRQGIEYRFLAAVTVPAASGDGPGRATAAIEAVVGGETANRDTGMLSGRLENGVYYSNRDAAVAGGTDLKRAVVAQADIDALVASANEQLPELARTRGTGDGRIVIPGSIQAGEFSYTVSAQPGEPADVVRIDARMTVQAIAFSPAEANERAAAHLEAALAEHVPVGAELVPGTVAYGTPELLNDDGQSALFRLQATADTRPALTEDRRAQIAEALAGMSVDEAAAFAAALPEVASVRIASSPGFLPARIPGDPAKIEIETS